MDLDGHVYGLASLANDEQELIQRLKELAATRPEWSEYRNFYMRELARFGENARTDTRRYSAFARVAYRQDLSNRIGIAAGLVAPPDYRDELDLLIKMKFRTRRAFCEATGLSEDMLSHVLARRKHLGIDTLADALAKIGYTVHIAPLPELK